MTWIKILIILKAITAASTHIIRIASVDKCGLFISDLLFRGTSDWGRPDSPSGV